MNSEFASKGEKPFLWKGITVHQHDQVMKVGTDALLLGTWIPSICNSAKHILDVGTGTGILALLMARAYTPSCIVAIDQDENAVHLARFNVGSSIFKDRVDVVQADVLDYSASAYRQFDLVVCNPPFYMDHILPAKEWEQSSKHASASPEKWMAALSYLVSDSGCICIVVPAMMSFEWIRVANIHQVYCSQRMDVFSFPGDRLAKRSLLCLMKGLRKPVHERLIMYAQEKIYTAQFQSWIGI